MTRHVKATAVLFLWAIAVGCAGGLDDDDGRPLDERPSQLNVCFGTTLDVWPTTVQETNHTLSSRRHFDRVPLCWTWNETRDRPNDRVTFELSRTFSIAEDGTRYGCRFFGSGNSLRATVDEADCLIEQEGGHLRLSLKEPAQVQIQDLASTQLVLNLLVEERRLDWILLRGEARLDLANAFSVMQIPDRGELDLDIRGPTADLWTSCPQAPYCFAVDLTGGSRLEGDTADSEVCADWLSRLQYGRLSHRVDQSFALDWQRQGSTLYQGVRDLDACELRAFSGSMDTRNDYLVELREGGAFRMDLRSYHQTTIAGVPRTAFCHGVWTGAVEEEACP